MVDWRADTLKSEIARRIRDFRAFKGWTLERLARETGFTKSYLSQVENTKKEPPISSLNKIAYALGVDVLELITGESREAVDSPLTIVRADERKPLTPPSALSTLTYESLTFKRKRRLMDGYLLTAGFESPEEAAIHNGEELVFMLEGEAEFFYDGETYRVKAGDCYYFDSNRPHYGRSIGDTPAKFIVVFSSRSTLNPDTIL